MYFDFAFFLTALVLISGIISLVDLLFFAKKRKQAGGKKPWYVAYSREFFPVLLLVWGIRSFIIQPYRVPTGSLEPTILTGEFIAVNQFAYGLKFPVGNYKLVNIGEPKRGDIALFRWTAVDPSKILIKRVIGLPGDHIAYHNKQLFINGEKIPQKELGSALDVEPDQLPVPVFEKLENLFGIKHKIYHWQQGGYTKDFSYTVPKGHYFMMGDNRDDSDDSRMWGSVPEKDLIGQAFLVWMSWDSEKSSVRWHRIGTKIK